ncbi:MULTISPECIES: hypothetical protein [unclassified Ochrobactrum]|uniref:hypothetical protein n=1 Tax=unclassified Ochrobactrum TaxID=239106 RepID=UPI00111EECEF|nr:MULTISPECIES: hypothetical protein [unclassified Ochrobactrum]NKE77819.1 hypothetical protein [Ochrobactrum sp. MC-1LL]
MAEEMTDAERLYYVLRHGYVNVAIGTDVCLVAHRDGQMSDAQLDAAIALIDDKIRSERRWGATIDEVADFARLYKSAKQRGLI